MSDLRTELLRIREKRGLLTPRIVYEEAKAKNHPLHDRVIDLPMREAAEAHYISNAARLLRVTFRADMGGRPVDLRAFWVQKGTEDSPESQYVPIEEIAVDPLAQKLMTRQMERDWQRLRVRWENHVGFFEMIAGDLPDTGSEG